MTLKFQGSYSDMFGNDYLDNSWRWYVQNQLGTRQMTSRDP